MATTAQIQAALADAQSGGLSWGEKAALLKKAIDNALVTDSGTVELPWTTAGSDGTSLSRIPLDQAVALAVKLESLDSGGLVGQYAELRDADGRCR